METIINKLRPSQWVNLGYYLLCLLLAPLVIGIIMFLVRYIKTKCNAFTLTEERIILSSGVFSKLHNEIELFRVKDVVIEQPFMLRIVGLSNIIVKSSDTTVPEFKLYGVHNGMTVKNLIRDNALRERQEKKVREIDGL